MFKVSESFKKIVVSDFDYFKKWYNFNFNIEKYLFESDLEKVFSIYQKDVFEILVSSNCSKTTVRKNLLKIFGLKEAVDYDIDSQQVRLATTGREILLSSMAMAGAVFYHKDIVKIISKKELEAVVKFIGRDVYSFIIKRGMLLWKLVPDIKITPIKKVSITEKITVAGKAILCHALFGLPIEIKKRLELMFDERLEIPEKCDELLSKKCFDLVKFAIENLKQK